VDQNNKAIRYKLRPTSEIGKVMKAFSERIGFPDSRLRYVFDGKRIRIDDTPLGLSLNEVNTFNVV
jgi:hypothetical protein